MSSSEEERLVSALLMEAGSELQQRAQALDAPVDKFPDWQENTNSIFCEDHSLVRDSKWKSGSISNRNPGREAHARGEESERIYTRAPPQRVGRALALLTKTYHGSRITGQWALGRFPGSDNRVNQDLAAH